MDRPLPPSRRGNGALYAVPAIHFCQPFASEVNRLCSQPATRPDAIAVELGPASAKAALHWVGELTAKRGRRNRFPVMLGLLKQNRRIRASLRERVFELQVKSGRDIHEFEPGVRNGKPGLSPHSVLLLSPVDSIIEAIRCALELRVPLYGVDLEENINRIHREVMIQDPRSCKEGLAAYTMANLPMADAGRDPEIDTPREIAMAARLKTLLHMHGKVLFTGGMAHWLKVQELLADDALKAAPVAPNGGGEPDAFTKVVVHPTIAVQYLDLFPPLALAYEKVRRAPSAPPKDSGRVPDPGALYRALLDSSYRGYFARSPRKAFSETRARDLESIPAFEEYLQGIQRLSLRAVPDVFMTLNAARETMSGLFTDILSEAFMDFPWARPRDYPGCSLLLPPSHPAAESGCALLFEEGASPGHPIYLRSVPDFHPAPGGARIPCRWEVETAPVPLLSRYTWRPWEYLISSMTSRAMRAAVKRRTARRTVPFEGNLMEGMDTKSTLRSFSRGTERLYVVDRAYEEAPASSGLMDGFPVVWILDPGKHPGSRWKILYEPDFYMRKHIRDKIAFDEIVKTKGDCMGAIIAFGNTRNSRLRTDDGESYSIDHYHGMLLFQPLCWTDRQFAHWVETTRYERNPFYHGEGSHLFSEAGLRKWCGGRFPLRLRDHDWPTGMVLMALPFCTRSLTVVIPRGYRLEPVARERARDYGVDLVTIPLDRFPGSRIRRMSQCHLVPALTLDPEIVYSKSLERAIGEPQTKNRGLVPREWLHFGSEDAR